MRFQLIEEFEDCPVIAAIKDEEGLKRCIHSDIPLCLSCMEMSVISARLSVV